MIEDLFRKLHPQDGECPEWAKELCLEFGNYERGTSSWTDITHWMPLPKVHKYFENKKEELDYYMPCFVYYDKQKGSGTVNRIGIAESFLGDKVIIREGNNCRDIYDIDSIDIINLND